VQFVKNSAIRYQGNRSAALPALRGTAAKGRGRAGQRVSPPPEVIQRQTGINDGKGFVFVLHTGEIYPSGFLPVSAGNVRRNSLTNVYRNSPLFRTLRDAGNLRGKCGDCEFRNLCGGSRSRSFAFTGDFLAEDPKCIYQPKATEPLLPTRVAPGLLSFDPAALVQLRG
jgi:radical SAM protein with 4Fe4S-binding SPASM domain